MDALRFSRAVQLSETSLPVWVFLASTAGHIPLFNRLTRSLDEDAKLLLIDVRDLNIERSATDERTLQLNFVGRLIKRVPVQIEFVLFRVAEIISGIFFLVGRVAATTPWGRWLITRILTSMLHYVRVQASAFVGTLRAPKAPGILILLLLSQSMRQYFYACCRARIVKNMLTTCHADLVVLPEDNILDLSAVWFQELKTMDIPAVVVQYTTGVEQEWIQHFSNTPATAKNRAQSSMVRALWPSFARTDPSGRMLSFPWIVPASCAYVEQIPHDPWSGYGGFASAYLVDSPLEAMNARHALRFHDLVHDVEPIEVTMALELREQLGVRRDRPLVAVLTPPNQFGSPEALSKYHRLIKEIVETVRVSLIDIGDFVIVPHPRSQVELQEILRELDSQPDLELDLINALASCSVILTFGSATARLAEDLDIGLLNWDIYGYGYRDNFRHSVKRQSVRTANQIPSALASIIRHSVGPRAVPRRTPLKDSLFQVLEIQT